MQKTDIKLFKRFDILIFVLIIALAASLFLIGMNQNDAQRLIISIDGVDSVYSLEGEQEIPVEANGIKLTAVIKDGKAYVKSSDCEDKVCVHSGKINKAGQIIVCAPAKVSLRIAKDGGEYDGITG